MDASGREAERTRAGFGFAVFVGVFVMLLSAIPLLPSLGLPAGFLVAGGLGATPTFGFLAWRIGAAKAAAVSALVAVIFGLGLMAIGFVTWLLGA